MKNTIIPNKKSPRLGAACSILGPSKSDENIKKQIIEAVPDARLVTDREATECKPTYKFRLADDLFLAAFHVVSGVPGIAGLEQATQYIVANYLRESSLGIRTWILCFSDAGMALHSGGTEAGEENPILTVANDGEGTKDLSFSNSPIKQTVCAGIEEAKLATKFGHSLADKMLHALDQGSGDRLSFVSNELGWGTGKQIKDDLPEGITECFCFSEVGGSLSDAVVLFTNYNILSTAGARRAFDALQEVSGNLRLKGKSVTLGLVYGEFEALVFSPGRNRDVKIPYTFDRIKEHGWVRNSLYSLIGKNLPRNKRNEIDVDNIFQTGELDFKFYELCTDFRLCLIDKLIVEKNLAIKALEQFQTSKSNSKVKITDLATDHDLQSKFLAIVDSLVLRTILHRFIEVYHGYPIKPTHDDMLSRYGKKQTKQKHEVGLKRKGKAARFVDATELIKGLEREFKVQFLAVDKSYQDKYGGDIHFSKMAKAVRFLEEEIGAEDLFELLDLTNQKRYSFHYEDLRPDALENFYQRSLETAIRFKKVNGAIDVVVENSKQARKDLGAYYTPAIAANFGVKHSLGKLLEHRDDLIEEAFDKGDHFAATKLIQQFLTTRICDPTIGGGSFLKESFRQFADSFWFKKLNSWIDRLDDKFVNELQGEFRWISRRVVYSDFENHILTNCLYGVDIDLKALSVASQTLTLEALSYLDGEERFPNFININLKVGNTFASYFEEDKEWRNCDPKTIQALMRVRKTVRTLANHSELEALLLEERRLLRVLYGQLASVKHNKWGLDITELSPFCWQLEFPEVFFDSNGKAKDTPGFDCIVGNPPWENIKPCDEDFFESIDPEWESGKNNKDWQTARIRYLKKDVFVLKLYEAYLHQKTLFNKLLGVSEQYKLLDPEFEHVGGGNGDPNTFKLACELYYNLVSEAGAFGFLVPEGFTGNKGTRDLRRKYVETRVLDSIVAFNEDNEIFVDATQAFCILTGQKFNKLNGYTYVSNLKTRMDLIQLDIGRLPRMRYDSASTLRIETAPLFPIRNEIEAQVLEKIFRYESPAESRLPWDIQPYTELHTTSDFGLTKNPTHGYFICKGEHMGRFQKPSEVPYGLNRAGLYAEKKWAALVEEERVAWRNIQGLNTPRRMYAAIIPPKVACFNSLNVIKGPPTSVERHFLVSILNSFCYEYFIRLQSKNNNLNIYFVALSPLPRLPEKDPRGLKLVELSKELHRKALLLERRNALEAELEANVAKVYGFSREEFAYILSTFDRVDSKYKEMVLAYFEKGQRRAA